MKIIGITGGVGSGKSRILSFMENGYGACVCQADHVAWELQCPGMACYTQIIEAFGKGILNVDNSINRGTLGNLVFSDKDKLSQLNAIMHPAVKEEIIKRIEEEKKKGTTLFLLEAALLLENGYEKICDELWYIYAREDVRKKRLTKERGYTEEKTNAIMKSQLPEHVFRERCHLIIDNSGDFEDTIYQIQKEMKC